MREVADLALAERARLRSRIDPTGDQLATAGQPPALVDGQWPAPDIAA